MLNDYMIVYTMLIYYNRIALIECKQLKIQLLFILF